MVTSIFSSTDLCLTFLFSLCPELTAAAFVCHSQHNVCGSVAERTVKHPALAATATCIEMLDGQLSQPELSQNSPFP